MKYAIRAMPMILAAMVLTASACGDDAPETSGVPARGTAQKGQACAKALDCADPAAICGLSKACTGAIGPDAFETECTTAEAESCAGLVCYGLAANEQNKSGICSMKCALNADCGSGGVCLDENQSTNLCFSLCTTDADCSNGFVCTGDISGKVCRVVLTQ